MQAIQESVLARGARREDVADALILPRYRTIGRSPERARVGTGSPRRRDNVTLTLRPICRWISLRGNVETRLNQALEGTLDAVILAWAGLHRLGLECHVTERLNPPGFLPAVGQGARGIECRRTDTETLGLLELLDDSATHRAVVAERATLALLEGGCTLPMAAWARDIERENLDREMPLLVIDAAVFDVNGSVRISCT